MPERPSNMAVASVISTTPKARNSQSLSVSELTRVMRLPVFLREKKLMLSLCKWSYTSSRRSLATSSPSSAIRRSRIHTQSWRAT